MRLSPDGTLLATASGKGTLIRVFDTETAKKIAEFRRGSDYALISDIIIDKDNKYISCASDKGTAHIFALKGGEVENKKSSLYALGGGYFGGQWSFGQFKVKDPVCKLALLEDKIFAVSTQGRYFQGTVGKDEIKIDKQNNLLTEQDEED